MKRGTGLSLNQLRRLDEVVDDWARWFCVRPNPAAHYAAPAGYGMAIDTSRQWMHTEEVLDTILRNICAIVDVAVDEMPESHRRVLHAWAWQEHYNRRIVAQVRMREAIERERQASVFRSNQRVQAGPLVTDETVEDAKRALVPRLIAHGVEI